MCIHAQKHFGNSIHMQRFLKCFPLIHCLLASQCVLPYFHSTNALPYTEIVHLSEILRGGKDLSPSARWYKIIACITFSLVSVSLAKYPSATYYGLLHSLMCVSQVFPLQPEVSLTLSYPHLPLYSFELLNLLLSSLTERLCPFFLHRHLPLPPSHPCTSSPFSMASFMTCLDSLSSLS